ncbi:MAG: hypothetical protein VX642_05420 [Bdellovibrionota bacterium]|nr:hypothetical protein [Bdellovibrionota bacterium]
MKLIILMVTFLSAVNLFGSTDTGLSKDLNNLVDNSTPQDNYACRGDGAVL